MQALNGERYPYPGKYALNVLAEAVEADEALREVQLAFRPLEPAAARYRSSLVQTQRNGWEVVRANQVE